jgi:hypothetical protein
MISAAFGAIAGIVTGVLPDLVKEVRDHMAARRDRERAELEISARREGVRTEAEAREHEQRLALFAAEVRAMRETMAAAQEAGRQPSGVHWIDAFNAMMRPAITTVATLLFAFIAVVFTAATYSSFMAGAINAEQFAAILLGGTLGEVVFMVLGYWFGHRPMAKALLQSVRSAKA